MQPRHAHCHTPIAAAAQCPLPNARCPMPNAHNARIPAQAHHHFAQVRTCMHNKYLHICSKVARQRRQEHAMVLVQTLDLTLAELVHQFLRLLRQSTRGRKHRRLHLLCRKRKKRGHRSPAGSNAAISMQSIRGITRHTLHRHCTACHTPTLRPAQFHFMHFCHPRCLFGWLFENLKKTLQQKNGFSTGGTVFWPGGTVHGPYRWAKPVFFIFFPKPSGLSLSLNRT